MQRWLFYETGVSNEMFVPMNEDEPVSELVIPPVVATVSKINVEPVQINQTTTERVIVKKISVDMIDKMHVSPLEVEL